MVFFYNRHPLSTSTNNGVDMSANTTSRQLTIDGATVDALSANDDIRNGGYETTLNKCSRSVYALCQEYQFGIGRKEAARLFTSAERGRVNIITFLGNIFLDSMENDAIDKFYTVYDRDRNVTSILRELRKDTRNGSYSRLVL